MAKTLVTDKSLCQRKDSGDAAVRVMIKLFLFNAESGLISGTLPQKTEYPVFIVDKMG